MSLPYISGPGDYASVTDNTTSIVVNVYKGPQMPSVGDWVIIVMSCKNEFSTAIPDILPPAGWTIGSGHTFTQGGSYGVRTCMYYRRIQMGDTYPYTFNFNAGYCTKTFQAVTVAGGSQIYSPSSGSGSSPTITWPAWTATNGDTLGIYIGYGATDGGNTSGTKYPQVAPTNTIKTGDNTGQTMGVSYWQRLQGQTATSTSAPGYAGDINYVNAWWLFLVVAPPELGSMAIDAEIPDNAPSSSLVANLASRRTSGSTVTLSGSDAARFSWNNGTSLLLTNGAIDRPIGDVYIFDIIETLADAINSPRRSTVAVTVVEGYRGPLIRSTTTTLASGTANVTPALPSGWQPDDLMLLLCETSNQTVNAPTDWIEFLSVSPITAGTGTTTSVTRLTTFFRIAASGMTAPTVLDPGDHCAAMIVAISNVDMNAALDTVTSALSSASTAASFPAINNTDKHVLSILAISVDTDIATARVNSWPTGNPGPWVEFFDQATTQGNGGGIALARQYIVNAANAAPSGNAILATSSRQAKWHMVLRAPGNTTPTPPAAPVATSNWT